MEKAPPHPNSLRTLIKLAGYSFREVAKETNVSERTLYYWAAGRSSIPYHDRVTLAHLLGCSVEELAPSQISQSMIQLPGDDSQSREQEAMNKKRRELLQLLSIAGSILVLPDIDWEKVDHMMSRPSHLDEMGLRDLETINHHYWRIYCLSSVKGTVLEGVLGQVKTLIGLLQTARSARLQKGLNVLACDLAQLAGEIFFDNNDYDTAQSCYTFAAITAKEAAHSDLWACALVRNAFLPIYDKKYQEALPLLSQAEQIAARGDTALVTRYWVAAVSAEAHAGAGNFAACQKALDLAEQVRSVQSAGNGGWLRFDGTRLPEQRGACFVNLKQPDLAWSALNEALGQHPTPTRRRGMVLNDLALTVLQQQDVEQACIYAHEIIDIARQSPSGMLKKRLVALRVQLKPFEETEAAKQFDQHLRELI